jgi:ketosteroid isomerase-like protein
MYKTIVAAQVRKIFAEINTGNYQAMIDGLAPEFDYYFLGDHPLSGHRTKVATMDLWWQRVFRFLPNTHFTVHDVIVQGHPLNTRVATRLTIRGTLASGEVYSNDVMQFMRLRLGKLTRIETMEDTAKFERLLVRLAAEGHPDAAAPPLND